MGICCDKIKQIDKDFNLENISNRQLEEKENKCLSKTKNIIQSENKSVISEKFDYSSNLEDLKKSKYSILNYKKERATNNMMKLISHATFREISYRFNLNFVKEINKAR